jgi:hypothetical protein
MLPFLRIFPVGGVLLAIMIVVLALEPRDGAHSTLTPAAVPARGALMRTSEHPEWRQFLMQAAVRRADELSHLRELPDTPVGSDDAQDAAQVADKIADKIAGLPTSRSDNDPDDETGTISEVPSATLPLEIGETSSTELPVTVREEKRPVIKTPERKTPNQSRRTTPHRPRQAKTPAKPEPTAQPNLFDMIFGGPRIQQPAVLSGPSSATIGADQH